MKARDRHFNEAKKNEEAGEFKAALQCYRKSLELDKRFFDGWLNAGVVFSKLKQSEKALHCFENALTCQPDERAFYNMAAEYYKLENYIKTLELLDKSIEHNPQFIRSYLLAGYSCNKLMNPVKAEEYFQGALKIDSQNISVYIALILILHETGAEQNGSAKRKQAKQYLDKAISISPGHPVLIKMKGIMELEEGNVLESIEQYKKLAGDDKEIHNLYLSFEHSVPQRQKEHIENKLADLSQKDSKTPKDFFDLSLMSILQGQGDNAMDYLMQGVEAHANN